MLYGVGLTTLGLGLSASQDALAYLEELVEQAYTELHK